MGPPYRKWIVCHASSPAPTAIPYPEYCFDNPHFTCLPRICHNQWLRQWIIIYIYPVISCLQMEESSCPVVSIGDQLQIERRYLRSKHRIEMDRANLYPYWIFNIDESRHFFEFFFVVFCCLIYSKFNNNLTKQKKNIEFLRDWLQSLVVSSARNLLFFREESLFCYLLHDIKISLKKKLFKKFTLIISIWRLLKFYFDEILIFLYYFNQFQYYLYCR